MSVSRQSTYKIMVWGAISWWGKTRLVRMPKGHKIDAASYIDTLKNHGIPDLHTLFDGFGFEFQQVGLSLAVTSLYVPSNCWKSVVCDFQLEISC